MPIRVLVTGGTFDKNYDELTGLLVLPGDTRAGRCCGSAGLVVDLVRRNRHDD